MANATLGAKPSLTTDKIGNNYLAGEVNQLSPLSRLSELSLATLIIGLRIFQIINYYFMQGNHNPQQPRRPKVWLPGVDDYWIELAQHYEEFIFRMHAHFVDQESFIVSALRDMRQALRRRPNNYRGQVKVLAWLDKCFQGIDSQFPMQEPRFSEIRKQIEAEIRKRKARIQEQDQLLVLINTNKKDQEELRQMTKNNERRLKDLKRLNDQIQKKCRGIRVICKIRPVKPEKSEAITVKDLFHIQVEREKRDLSKPKVQPPPKTTKMESRSLSKSKMLPQSTIKAKQPINEVVNLPRKVETEKTIYTFDYILGPKDSQKGSFQMFSYLVDHLLQGGNGCLLSYGISGSGKTYSLQGPRSQWSQHNFSITDSSGIIPRVLQYLFLNLKRSEAENGMKFRVQIQFKEMYQEEKGDNEEKSYSYDYVLTSEKRIPISSASQGFFLLKDRMKSRKVRKLSHNTKSSSSHFFVIIFYSGLNQNIQVSGQLALIDLAGNQKMESTEIHSKSKVLEKEGKRNPEVKRTDETKFINRTLFDLTMALKQQKRGEKPKCDNKFDRDMRPYLFAPSTRIAVLLTLSPETDQVRRSTSTLKFAEELCPNYL